MRRISARRPVYRAPPDPRQETLRLGKWIYLALITAFVLYLGHTFLGWVYVASGDGFIQSDRHAVAMPFEAEVRELPVQAGDRVAAGEVLITYRSLRLELRLAELRVRLADLMEEALAHRIERASAGARLEAGQRFLDTLRRRGGDLEALADEGLMTNRRYYDELERRLDLVQEQAALTAEREESASRLAVLEESIAELRAQMADLRQAYDGGVKRAARAGVVADLTVTPGEVVAAGDTVMRLYHGPRYVFGYLDPDSLVSVEEGDPILVDLPGGRVTVGRVREMRAVSQALPEEFQRRTQPTERHQLVVVTLPSEDLEALPILTKVALRKPLGLELLR